MSYGVPTQVDMMNGFAYAIMQVNKMKCQDPDIVKAVCTANNAGGGNCINWVEDKSIQTFPTPANYYTSQCSKDSDCQMGHCNTATGQCSCYKDTDCTLGMGCIQNPNNPASLVCGYAPPTSAGHCQFTTESACVAQGELPYICNDSQCIMKPAGTGPQKSYTEWQVDDNGQGKCVLGNFVLRQWCENPVSRCTKNSDGSFPPNCTGGADTPGVVNVPPFYYDRNRGQCYMTHDYCGAFGLDFNKGTCNSDSDCPGNNNHCDMSGELGYHCTGPDAQCTESSGQQIGEFLVGKTLFYLFSKDFKCENYERTTQPLPSSAQPLPSSAQPLPSSASPTRQDYEQLGKKIVEKFSTQPDTACSLADSKHMDKKVLIGKNFAGEGINLYMIRWKGVSGKPGKTEVGFDADEVAKKYPDVVEEHVQGKIICINKNELKGDKNLKRIYMTLNSKGWMTSNLGVLGKTRSSEM